MQSSYSNSFFARPLHGHALNKDIAAVNLAKSRGSLKTPCVDFGAGTLYTDTFRSTDGFLNLERPECSRNFGLGRSLSMGDLPDGTPISRDQFRKPPLQSWVRSERAVRSDNLGIVEGRPTDFWTSSYKQEFQGQRRRKRAPLGV
mmetsp:Transcript_79912/g.171239  ORF Transcript_79912/g.171239 Transcript_79912/m.171239 type:complete len:145 (+) Transcript_79912:81-515(+)